jgi:hypothetical protein
VADVGFELPKRTPESPHFSEALGQLNEDDSAVTFSIHETPKPEDLVFDLIFFDLVLKRTTSEKDEQFDIVATGLQLAGKSAGLRLGATKV